MSDVGFDFEFSLTYLKPAMIVSLLSVWVLVGVFHYLNRYTRRKYFTIWTAAWLFYALWLTLCISYPRSSTPPFIQLLKQWCVGTSAAFLLWGASRFLKLKTPQRLFGLFFGFLFLWSYLGAYELDNSLASQIPVFGLMGSASGLSAWCFIKVRRRRHYVGAGLLAFGFALWGLYLGAYPFLQESEHLISCGFFISAVLQLFIAVSMIVVVLEEVRTIQEIHRKRLNHQKTETDFLKRRVVSTEERYRNLFELASDGIIITSEQLDILEINQTARRLFGLSGSDVRQLAISAICQPANAVSTPDNWLEMVKGQRHLFLTRRDGRNVQVEVEGATIQFDGQPAYQFLFHEITERGRLEQQLRQAEKLSALGQMISGVAHELNNPLAVIKGYLELVLAKHELGAQTRTDLQKVAHESNRAAKLVSNFLSFAREQQANRQKVDLGEVIERVLDLRGYEFQVESTELIKELAANLPKTWADADQIQQIVVNLIQNSLQALESTPGHRKVRISTFEKGGYIHIKIEDNGPGIPPNVLPHIFEPFFTTKEVGTGTGLGLSIAHSIMTDHKGRIYYEPSSLGGAGFILELPILSEAQPAPSMQTESTSTAPSAQALPANAKILVLDDENSIAELLGEMLSLLGYSVSLSHQPQHALELLERERFDLILSDFRMPTMNGQEFYAEAVRRHPALASRIIFLTGDVLSEDTKSFLESTGNPHLSKPFQMASIENAVSKVLRLNTVSGN